MLYRDYLFVGTIWSRAIISLLFGFRNRLAGLIWFPPPAGTVWSRGLFGFAFSAPRIGTLQLLETNANDDGHDNFYASPRRLDEPKSSATCFFFVCIWLHMNAKVIATLSIAILRV